MHLKSKRVLFITLRTFSLTGGIEKVCRGIGYALQQMQKNGTITFNMISLYDDRPDERYVSAKNFKGYNINRTQGLLASIKAGLSADIIILSHINLSIVGLAIKILKPKTQVILWAHGIEIWIPLNRTKKKFLQLVDKIISVSTFTARTLPQQQHADKIQVIPNALDPYFVVPNVGNGASATSIEPIDQILEVNNNDLTRVDANTSLRERYKLKPGKKILIAVTRLSNTETYKNYDKVIRILGELKRNGKEAYYILCGGYGKAEYTRIMDVAKKAEMEDLLILTGFIPDDELPAHYQLADAFVLPSTKEGFGIVFIEAQACGLRVLAGNQDGTTEAVLNEQAGILVNPDNENELASALEDLISGPGTAIPKAETQKQAIEHFSFQVFQKNIQDLINDHANR